MDDMENKLTNTIALGQATINELLEIKKYVQEHIEDDVSFIVETKHLMLGTHIIKKKKKIDTSVSTMDVILTEAINYERSIIDKCIDKLIDYKMANKNVED